MAPLLQRLVYASLGVGLLSNASPLQYRATGKDLDDCPGYSASNVQYTNNGLTADLKLAGKACNVYGSDIEDLTLTVEYQTDSRLHVLIEDAAQQVYQVPETVLPRPSGAFETSGGDHELEFDWANEPFSFSVKRSGTNEILFDSSAAGLVFESQYVRLRTHLPDVPSLYGLGEHTDPFMLNTTNYTRTIWNRDAYGVPPGTNLYGDHPVYYDHRGSDGTHGVFLLNSNGMDVKIDDSDGTYLEYNILGGVLDFYFLAGPTPVQVAKQYAKVVGLPAMMPYWGFGYHHCRYGMRDIYEVASVVYNYSQAGIPLETMWTDIDYMFLRRVFTLDPDRFPLDMVRELVNYLHEHQQHYIVMVDPAVAFIEDNGAFSNGASQDVFLKKDDGSWFNGVVWPGVTVFPDWFHPNTQPYWNSEFAEFFDADTGVDIDALWIDMNEAANFCNWPCKNPELEAIRAGNPPRPPPVRISSPMELPGFPEDFQPSCIAEVTFNVQAKTIEGEGIVILGNTVTLGDGDPEKAVYMDGDDAPMYTLTLEQPANTEISYEYVRYETTDGTYVFEDKNRTFMTGGCGTSHTLKDTITTKTPSQSNNKRSLGKLAITQPQVEKRQSSGDMKGLPGRDLIDPPYTINNAAGSLSNKTIDTNLVHYNGLVEYDTHNMYGAMMSEASRVAMLNRRPGLRPLVITRSTFAGSGRQVGHWLGDNLADWDHYRFSIAGMLNFGSLFQVPMVGSDVCGFGGTTNEHLCARWATLGAFYPFYRNHGNLDSPPHEFYRWPLVTSAAKNAIDARYRLLDYIYTAMYLQNVTGVPLIQPMFFAYPEDSKCNALEYQFLWGPGVMVAPVTGDNSTTSRHYLPDDVFYDFYSHETVRGEGKYVEVDVPFDEIQLYYKGGNIIAERSESTNTTTELRKKNFSLTIAPGLDGNASGQLYLDDGVSIEQEGITYVEFSYTKDGVFSMNGHFGYDAGVYIESIVVLGSGSEDKQVLIHEPIPLSDRYTIQT